jgi:pimeloyl-ACP methyl ester carboxylesterase
VSASPGCLVLGWGKRDLVALPRQARRAQEQFPDTRVVWLGGSGHFPRWDEPEETTRLILDTTA